MKKKNGFISMSLVYSFFVVFIAISISLLSVYTTNLSLVRNINREIKDDLITRGNDSLIVFYNLIPDGSFEQMTSVNMGGTWSESNTGSDTWTTTKCYCSYGSGTMHSLVTSKHHYHGNNSLHFVGSGLKEAVTKETISMIEDHVYYMQRIYQVPLELSASESAKTSINFTSSCGNTYTIPSTAGQIARTSARTLSGWCGKACGVNQTIESGIFKFLPTIPVGKSCNLTDNYNLKIQSNFSNSNSQFFTDSYILIDLTEAYGTEMALKMVCNEANITKTTQAIEEIIGSTYFTGRKIFSTYKANIENLTTCS